MKIIIFGGGGVGESTAKLLIRHGHHVVIIDRSKEVCEHLASDLPEADVLVGQATSPVVLKRAGISNADVFVAVTGSDEANVMSAILAKTMGAKKVIVRVKDPTYVEICKLLGLNEIVNPSESTAIRIDAKIRGLKLAEALEMIEKYIDIEEIAVDERCKYMYCNI
ncbi:MAG: NAD-binding protein, partial [Candidatus Verstraetearchaeota archaeon]|nr:NAD-binding protein [Candidatus Verstraetearchaeota archaeon]